MADTAGETSSSWKVAAKADDGKADDPDGTLGSPAGIEMTTPSVGAEQSNAAEGAPTSSSPEVGRIEVPDQIIKLSQSKRQPGGVIEKLLFQIRLLMWKRFVEQTKNKNDLLKLFVPPVIIFVLLILIYEAFTFFADGGVEQILVPMAFWIYIQRLAVHIMYEKSTRLQESMRMMGLSDVAYWTSYFITDGIILGFVLSMVCSILSVGGLFGGANFGEIFGMLLVFCLSAVPFSFFFTSFFDTPQTCGQAVFGLLLGMTALFIVVIMADEKTVTLETAQNVFCLFPPLALHIATTTFLKSHEGITLPTVCGWMVADVFIYSILAWYFTQVWPSKVGVRKPFYFVLQPSYWFPTCHARKQQQGHVDCSRRHSRILDEQSDGPTAAAAHAALADGSIPNEPVNESLLGAPTVVVDRLCKTFSGASSMAVNNLSFTMYENQIFALLGHNGAGKTTCINMLTGMTRPDLFHETDTSIYGSSLLHDMDQIRYSMGVCPQHDVLFEKLSVKEHIMFFSQLKGASYEQACQEAEYYTNLFHLKARLDHLGTELSGGQRRKLSVAIAVCGGSKFVVLDEPTAGMDPLARRELWDLLASLRTGRTMLLTTHYMDEADILGDRVGIMSLGQMQCAGSTQFLKTTFGTGYKLIFDILENTNSNSNSYSDDKDQGGTAAAAAATLSEKAAASLTALVQSHVPEAQRVFEDGAEMQVLFNLPFDAVSKFGALFTDLETRGDNGTLAQEFSVARNFGINITSLEDVFLKVGQDHTVTPTMITEPIKDAASGGDVAANASPAVGIGAETNYKVNFFSQLMGIIQRRLLYAVRDPVTIPLVLLPVAGAILGAVLYDLDILSEVEWIKDLLQAGVYAAAYLGIPGLLSEFVVRERNNKLRNVLTVMGCDFKAYWMGTFIADFILLIVPMFCTWIVWFATPIENYYNGARGLAFGFMILFALQMIAFSYLFSFAFKTPKACITFMPMIVLLLIILPNIVVIIIILIMELAGRELDDDSQAGILLWGTMITSPHGALFTGFLRSVNNYDGIIDNVPPRSAILTCIIVEAVIFMAVAYISDVQAIAVVMPQASDPDFDAATALKDLDDDVREERSRTHKQLGLQEAEDVEGGGGGDGELTGVGAMPLQLARVRKVFKPKVKGRKPVEAVQDVSFCVNGGEIFGLLGANGAGKTTVLSMLTRALIPTSGNGYIAGHSMLSDFAKGATHLGVVTQSNALWDRLTTEDHLYLFARLRGVPEHMVKAVVDSTVDQLELRPHRHKLSMRLSGGMKRKLCVAIALIGDPDVVLLDEPSAGLDPVSRRNLWSVILRTMSHRAVILTTHSMEEAEALCKRIGIMVHGQLRALGTKQHLKLKFGSGYEMVVKLHVSGADAHNDADTAAAAETTTTKADAAATTAAGNEKAQAEAALAAATAMFNQRKQQLLSFVTGLFPGAVVLTENGGLVTFRIPREEMKMGRAFTEMESHREELHVEDYSIAQPTLEQVFIRTITDERGQRASSRKQNPDDAATQPTPSGGLLRFLLPGRGLRDEIDQPLNKCGCTTRFTKIFTIGMFLAFCASWGIGFALGESDAAIAFWLAGYIFIISAIVGLNILCCACCRAPTGNDE